MGQIGNYGRDYNLGLFIDAILFEGNEVYGEPKGQIARMVVQTSPRSQGTTVIGRLYDYPSSEDALKQVFVPTRNPQNFLVLPVDDMEDEAETETVGYHGLSMGDL